MRKGVMQVFVRFLVHEGSDEVLAVFPYVVADMDGNLLCYQHTGQHGAVSKDYVKECRDATPEEKAALKKELQELGYYVEEN